MIAADLAAALDPIVFARRIDMQPDGWQGRALGSVARRTLWNCSRQAGKSTVAAVLAVHCAVYEGGLVLLVSPTLRQSQELFRKAIAILRTLDNPCPTIGENSFALELANGGRIISLPASESTVRGFSAPRLIVIDEASRVSDDLLSAVTPMLATSVHGRLLALSSPAGRRGWWWEAWEHGGDLWERVRVPAVDVPRITASFLEQERRTMPSSRYRQEYECSFEEADAAVFAADAITEATDHTKVPLALGVLQRWRAQ